jgi:enoyl-CoA hydratase/carnithine racemase
VEVARLNASEKTMNAISATATASAQEPPLLSEVRDGICFLTLNRPGQFNAYTLEMLGALQDALDAIAADESIRVVVITGSGRAFCAGCDLKRLRADYREEYVRDVFAACAAFMQRLQQLPQPVIAAVNGLTTAAGCELVAACDLAVAAENVRFAVSGIGVGLFCSTPAVPLSRNIGRKRALEMLMTGEFIDAQTALEWGLVNRVAPPERLMESVRAVADSLIAKPAKSLAMGKALFYRQLESPMAAAYEDAVDTITSNMLDPVAAEGVDAFLQKRPPRWK